MKKCKKCGEEKDESCFYKLDYKKKDGSRSLRNKCRACMNKEIEDNIENIRIKRQDYYKKNREKILNYTNENYKKYPEKRKLIVLKYRFGLKPEDYYKLLKEQNECCRICKKSQIEFKRALFVDHNHVTGQIRGLLCTNCNTALGQVKDSPKILKEMINYLEYYNNLKD